MNDMNTSVKELIRIARQAYDRGFTSGSGGNLSARCGDEFYISATGSYLGNLTEEDFTRMNLKGEVLEGRKPSKEAVMHLECYKRRPDIQSVIHLHPVHSIAVTCLKNSTPDCGMPVYTPGYALRINKLPVIPYYKPGSLELAMAVAEGIESRNSLLLKNHGLLVVGKSPQEAFGIAEEIEENAQIALILGEKGVPLNWEQIDELCNPGGKV